MPDKALAFLDIETSGLNPFEHDVMEVAYIREDSDGISRTTYFSLPYDHKKADPKALEINRAKEREAELADIVLSPYQAASAMLSGLTDCVIVGANPAFDTLFLRAFLWRYRKLEPTWHYRSVDLNTLAAGKLECALPISTEEIAEEFDVPLSDDQHTALADARWNQRAYHAICDA